MANTHIIAMGGGGFSMEPQNPLLDQYILSQARRKNPRVCFLPTASGDSERYVVNFYTAFTKHDCRPTHLFLFNRAFKDLAGFLQAQDVIYVGGGNTVNMLAIWRCHGVDAILRQAWREGAVMCGVSAGSLCWFESGVTDSYGLPLEPITGGLGLLTGSHCPHYDGEPTRRPTYQRCVAEGSVQPGIAVDDSCGTHYIDGELTHIVSSRPNAKAYRVERAETSAIETPLEARYLGTPQ